MRDRQPSRWWKARVAVAAAALALAGCAAGQAGKARPSGFLGDYAQLREGKDGQALMVYVDPAARFSSYKKVKIEPVTIWRSAETNDIPAHEARDLIDDLDDVLRMTLDDDYQLVDQAGPDVLRLRVAITEAEGSWRVIDGRLGDRLDPELQAATGKKPSDATRSFVGKAGIEAELLDGGSGKRVAAAIDRRVGARTLKPEANAWDDVEDAFRYWAERLRDRLRDLRKRS
jgi:hypothetical protein